MLSNQEIGARMQQRRQSLGLSMEDVGSKVGVASSTIQRYESGQIKKLKLPVIESIAAALGVSPAWIIGTTEDPTPTIVTLPRVENILPMPTMNKVPLMSTIACGIPILAEQNIEGEIDIPEHIRADFALRCKGDSMIGADIRDGDIVYIRQQKEVLNGQIAAVQIEDEATLKRWYHDPGTDVVTLVAENPAIPPQIYHGETLRGIEVLGLAVGFTRAL